MQVRPIRDAEELAELARCAEPLQAAPESHIAYLGVEADGILAELAEAPWADVSAVAVDDAGRIAGWMVGDVDPDMGRVWWLGPFVASGDWERVADELLAACRTRLGDGVTEEEMAVGAEFARCRSWAPVHGFVEGESSCALVMDQRLDREPVGVREISPEDHDAVAALHDVLFAGTHTTGRDLVTGHDEDHRRLVVDLDGRIAGYIAVERQPDGGGYIDFVGVAESARRRGLGGELVRAGVRELQRMGAAPIALTVREASAGARELYASLGFREERTLVPLRKGFVLD